MTKTKKISSGQPIKCWAKNNKTLFFKEFINTTHAQQ